VTTDRERWDERHASARGLPIAAPDAFVVSVLDELRDARSALDLACGVGRHALLLAERAERVEAWDVSPVALEILAERARSRGARVETRVTDLLLPLAPEPRFDLVLCVDFLSRPLFQSLFGLLERGGSAVVTTFTTDFAARHPSPRFRLARGELRSLPGLVTKRAVEDAGRAGIWAIRED
jgi:SAM-dependent methyltransferase